MIRKKNGFTIVELLAVLVLLGIIMWIVLVTVNGGFGNAKNKTEDIFIKTIEDALNIYLNSSEAKSLGYNDVVCSIDKTHKLGVKVYRANVSFNDVINSEYHPIAASDLINPANDGAKCTNLTGKIINIYRDEDYIYYYKIEKSDLNCLKNQTGSISNLPAGCNG